MTVERIQAYIQRGRGPLWCFGFVVGLATGLGALAFAKLHKYWITTFWRRKVLRRAPRRPRISEPDADFTPIELKRSGSIAPGIEGLIGNTPLMRIASLSDLTGCEILGKAEFLNPGGSPKDRVALQIITEAENNGLLVPNTGSWIFEGTVGSTGISLATLAKAKGYNCCIIVPDDVAEEKAMLLRSLGAVVQAVRPRGIVDPRHVRCYILTPSLSTKPGPAHKLGRLAKTSRMRAPFLRTSLKRKPTLMRITRIRGLRFGAKLAAILMPLWRGQAPAGHLLVYLRT